MVPLNDIEHRRGRLLASVFVVLAGFSALSVAFSLLGPSVLEPLQVTPAAARVGVLILTVGFIALVWEKERHFGSLSQSMARQEVLIASFENRIRVVEELMQATDRISGPLAIDDVMTVILDAAVDLVGAEAGTIEVPETDSEMVITRTKGTPPPPDGRMLARFPVNADQVEIGTLTLTLHKGEPGLDDNTLEVLERFTAQAGKSLQKAQLLARERASVAHLEATNAIKSRFLTTVSHELRTPLTSIIGFASTLDSHWDRLDESTRREFVGQIESNGHRLGGIVERLLEAARIEMQGLLVYPVLHDVRVSIEQAVLPFFRGPGGFRLQLILPTEPVEAEVDPFVVDQMVTNLVDNALRYTSGPVRVALDAFEHDLVFRVADTGQGIDPDVLKVVSDPFYRSEEAVESGRMGLHVVRMLVESHRGRGQIESDERGTTAVFVLPRFVSVTASTPREIDHVLS